MKCIGELGGFAEYEDDIDGDFKAFNYCLAEEYLNAMYMENFPVIGEISPNLLEKISYWINYDNKLGNKDYVKKIDNGTLITEKNRSLIDAIYENSIGSFAETYMLNGICNAKLILTVILSDEQYNAYIGNETYKKEDYDKLFNDLYSLIENKYAEVEDKTVFLKKVKNNYKRIKIMNNYKQEKVPNKFNWTEDIKKIVKTK